MMLGRVLVVSAPKPSFLPRIADQLLRIAQRDSLFSRKSFRALPNQHHVRAFLEDRASHQNGILHPLQRGSRASTQRRAVHHNGVALHAAVPVQVRAVARVENRIVFQYHDCGFDGLESIATF